MNQQTENVEELRAIIARQAAECARLNGEVEKWQTKYENELVINAELVSIARGLRAKDLVRRAREAVLSRN